MLRDVTEREQRERELEAIVTLSAALRTASTRAAMLPIIVDKLLILLDADGAALALRDPTSGDTVIEQARGDFTKGRMRLAPGEGVSGAVIAGGKLFVTNDIQKETGIAQPDAFETVRAIVCIPLVVQDQVIGALWVGRQSEISAAEIRLLTAIADIAANAIRRETLHEQTVQQLQRLAALHTINAAINSSFDLRVTLDIFLAQAIAYLNVDAASILRLSPHTLTLEYLAGKGFRSRAIEKTQLHLGEGYAGRAALERRTQSVPDLRSVGLEYGRKELLAGEEFVAYFGVPLVTKGKVIGVLDIFKRSPVTPDPGWLDFMEALAGQAAIAIENAQLFEHLQRSNVDLALAYDATIEGWSRALDLRDKETEGHTQRVAEVTMRMARAMGIADSELLHVRRGALLHDIGKMGVPDAVLLKPGPLTEEEWVLMRRHPQAAYDLLAPIDHLRPALDIPYCHHEKWDGTGYPRGLTGEQIPLVARLFAVVDVWDALCSDRPYRKAWTQEEALTHIRTGAGTHFDPRAVEVFLGVVSEGTGKR